MKVERRYTTEGADPYDGIAFPERTSRIVNPDGSVVFEATVTVPEAWSQVAVDILAQKYFRKAGVPAALRRSPRRACPTGCGAASPTRTRSPTADGRALRRRDRRRGRCSTAWPAAGRTGAGSTATSPPRRTRTPSTTSWPYMLPHQMAAPELARSGSTPACTGPTASPARRRATTTSIPSTGRGRALAPTPTRTRSRTPASSSPSPTTSSNEGGIMDLWVREARLFKYGSGTGTNFSRHPRRGRAALRRRQVVRPDELPARSATAPPARSSPAAPRAAPPRWSASTSITRTSRSSSTGRSSRSRRSRRSSPARKLLRASTSTRSSRAVPWRPRRGRRRFDRRKNTRLRRRDARRAAGACVPDNYIERALAARAAGRHRASSSPTTTPTGTPRPTPPSPARTRTTRCASPTSSWTRSRTTATGTCTGARAESRRARPRAQACKTLSARAVGRHLLRRLGAAPIPGLQYDTTINEWHTCPDDGRINASNPCSEYMFLDDTACNLASLNLHEVLDDEADRHVRRRRLPPRHRACGRSCSRSPCCMAQFPQRADRAKLATTSARSASATPTSARCSWCRASPTTRTKAVAICGALTADHAPATSYADLAPRWPQSMGPFPGYDAQPRADAPRHPQPPPRRLRRAPTTSTRASPSRPSRIDPAQLPAGPARRPRATRGTARSRSASSTATATRRSPCSRRPARSAC